MFTISSQRKTERRPIADHSHQGTQLFCCTTCSCNFMHNTSNHSNNQIYLYVRYSCRVSLLFESPIPYSSSDCIFRLHIQITNYNGKVSRRYASITQICESKLIVTRLYARIIYKCLQFLLFKWKGYTSPCDKVQRRYATISVELNFRASAFYQAPVAHYAQLSCNLIIGPRTWCLFNGNTLQLDFAAISSGSSGFTNGLEAIEEYASTLGRPKTPIIGKPLYLPLKG